MINVAPLKSKASKIIHDWVNFKKVKKQEKCDKNYKNE